MKKKVSQIILALTLVVLLLVPAAALAAGTDGAGNQFISESTSGSSVESDLYGAGETLALSGMQIGHSAILAARNVSLTDSTLGGSLRACGFSVDASNTTVNVNATVAGYSVTLGEGFAAKGVYAAAKTVSFSGKASTLYVGAQDVMLNGVIDGDATINAKTVTIGANAVINGTLYVNAATEPVVPATAKIGNLEFTLSENQEESETTTTQFGAAVALPFLRKLWNQTVLLPGRIVLALLFFLVIGGAIGKSGQMLVKRPVAMLVTGLVALLAAPIALLMLLLTVIGIPAAMLLLCLYILVLCFALTFTACAVGRLLFSDLNPLLACVIGAAVFSVASVVPILGSILRVACMIFALGYFLQTIYLGLVAKKAEKQAASASFASEATEPAQETVPGNHEAL